MRSFRLTRGHTLMEAMLASAIALVCALVFAATMPVANVTRGKSALMNNATSLAQKTIERVRQEGYANSTANRLVAIGLAESATPVNIGALGFGPPGEMALEATNIDAAQGDAPAQVLPDGRGFIKTEQMGMDMRRVTVIIGWREKDRIRSVRVGTLLGNF